MVDSTAWNDSFTSFNAKLHDFKMLSCFAESCGLQPWVVVAFTALVAGSTCYYGLAGDFVCRLAGFLYPGYASFKALEDGKMDEVCKWTQYWIVFAITMLTEGFFRQTLMWIPFFSLSRLAFIFWLFLPTTQGSLGVYSWIVRPLLRRYRRKIDTMLDWLCAEFRHRTTSISPVKAEETDSGTALEEIMINALRASAAPKVTPSSQEQREKTALARRRMASPAPRQAVLSPGTEAALSPGREAAARLTSGEPVSPPAIRVGGP
mmetsp:Transcript_61263/g.138606  ORF Transcript_61263/g.138606 Transcript_61263/m.138606 type:complete len:263 (-) Transcript_61263:101-889(-)